MVQQAAPSELTIQAILAGLRRRRALIAGTAAAFLLLGILACALMTRRYEAVAELQVAKSSSDGLGLQGMMGAAENSADALDENITLQTEAKILQSDTLALRVVENLDLEHTRDFAPSWNPAGWAMGLFSPAGPHDAADAALADAPQRRTRVLKTFAKNLTVKPVAGTRLITVSYLSRDPRTAAAVVNGLIKGLVDYGFETRSAATTQASGWLTGQIADVKKQAETLQSRVVELQRQSGVYSLGATDAAGHEMAYSATLDRLQQATQALTSAESARILKGGILEAVKGRDPELISSLAGSALAGASPAVNTSFNLLQNLRAQQAALQSQLATDASKYGSANPRLLDERASLESLDRSIRDEAGRIGARAENDYEVARSAEDGLRRAYDTQRAAAGKLNDKAIEYSIARQEAADSRQLYETLYQRLKEAGALRGLEATNVSVVDPARTPAKPAKPNVPLLVAASLAAGLFLGALAALFAEATDDRIQSLDSVEELEAPLMAVLPRFGEARGFALPGTRRRQLAEGASALGLPRPAVVDGPGSPFAEALRGLRTALEDAGGARPKVVLVTSSVPGEGKSTVSANVATLLAQSGERVLLIEGDMRRHSFARQFGPPADPKAGLSALLGGDRKEPVLDIQPGSGLRVLHAGSPPATPAELLGNNRMRALLDRLKPGFDTIVIDSPPLLAVTDALILSRLADLTLLVARHDLTTRRSLHRAYKLLAAQPGKPPARVGVVVNGVSRHSGAYHEYFGYTGPYASEPEGNAHA